MEQENIHNNNITNELVIADDITETDEYKNLFELAKKHYPNEYEYLLHIACISHLDEMKSKDKNLL